MTNLFDGHLTDLIQNNSRYNPEIRAISYAIRMEKQRIIRLADRTRTMAMIDQLPEPILDVLAVELRTPYYEGGMTLEQKRTIIKNTLAWFNKAGTPAAVEELVASTFGQGEVVEWFNFTEEPFTPGTFDIISDTPMSEDIVTKFSRIIQFVKNTRSHIRRVLVERHGNLSEYVGTTATATPNAPILNHKKASSTGSMQEKAGVGAFTAPATAITNGARNAEEKASGPAIAKAGVYAAPATNITNRTVPRTENASGPAYCAIWGKAAPTTKIGNRVAPRLRFTEGSIFIGTAPVVRDIRIAVLNSPPPGTVQVMHPLAVKIVVTSNSKITIGR